MKLLDFLNDFYFCLTLIYIVLAPNIGNKPMMPRSPNSPVYTKAIYRKVSNMRRTLVGNKIVDHSDVVGASPVGAAPATSSFST